MLKKSNAKTIRRIDVARAAGVSVTTVTHALNPPPGVRMNVKTKKRVCKIAREMGYRPNFFGKSLITGKSFAIGLLQPEFESLFLEFYQHMSYGLAGSMAKDDYNVLLTFKDERKNYLKLVRQGRVDGIIVMQSKSTVDDFKEIAATNIPVIMLNQPYDCSNFANCSNVVSDHKKLVDDIVKAFLANKRKSILSINDYNYCVPNFCVFEAFKKQTSDFNLFSLCPGTPYENILKGRLIEVFESGQRFDGVYIDGEELLGIYVDVALKYGMKCGRDYDLHVSSVVPEISAENFELPVTIHLQQGEKMGELAWETMKKIINREKFEKQVKVPYFRIS